jgi:copper chaperone CopZ
MSQRSLALLFLATLSTTSQPLNAEDTKTAAASCMTGETKAPAQALALPPSAMKEVAQGQDVALEVTKMHCGSCAAKVRKKIREYSSAMEISVDLDKSEARFTCSQESCALERLVSELAEMGYPSRLL